MKSICTKPEKGNRLIEEKVNDNHAEIWDLVAAIIRAWSEGPLPDYGVGTKLTRFVDNPLQTVQLHNTALTQSIDLHFMHSDPVLSMEVRDGPELILATEWTKHKKWQISKLGELLNLNVELKPSQGMIIFLSALARECKKPSLKKIIRTLVETKS